MRRFITVLPKSVLESIFKNRGIPTFVLGDYPYERDIRTNSRIPRGRSTSDRPIRAKLPSAGDGTDGKHWTAITTRRGNRIRLISVRRSRKGEERYSDQCE